MLKSKTLPACYIISAVVSATFNCKNKFQSWERLRGWCFDTTNLYFDFSNSIGEEGAMELHYIAEIFFRFYFYSEVGVEIAPACVMLLQIHLVSQDL